MIFNRKANMIKLSWWPDLGQYSRLTNPGTVHHCEIATIALRGVKKGLLQLSDAMLLQMRFCVDMFPMFEKVKKLLAHKFRNPTTQ